MPGTIQCAHMPQHGCSSPHDCMPPITVNTLHYMAMLSTPTQAKLRNTVHSVAAQMTSTGRLPTLLKFTGWHKALQPHWVPTLCFLSQSLHSPLGINPPICTLSVHTAQRNLCPTGSIGQLAVIEYNMMAMSAQKWPT